MTKKLLPIAILSFFTLVSFSSCGSGDSNDDEPARVLDLALNDNIISRGESTRLEVSFSFANERVFDDDDNVIIALKLPRGIRYDEGSGSVDSIGSDDDVDPRRFPCAADDGELLVFNLDEDDLTNANDPNGDADGKIRLDIDAIQAGVGTGTIEARAGYNLTYASCDASFTGEEIELITVFP